MIEDKNVDENNIFINEHINKDKIYYTISYVWPHEKLQDLYMRIMYEKGGEDYKLLMLKNEYEVFDAIYHPKKNNKLHEDGVLYQGQSLKDRPLFRKLFEIRKTINFKEFKIKIPEYFI